MRPASGPPMGRRCRPVAEALQGPAEAVRFGARLDDVRRSVIRSSSALHDRTFGITWVHSGNGRRPPVGEPPEFRYFPKDIPRFR